MRGIGALSFNLIGGTQVWFSRPHGRLAELYYTPDVIKSGVPIMALYPPTREMIHKSKMDYRIVACEEKYFRSPVDGSFLPGGTRIEITRLRDEVKNILHRDEIAARLKGLYGEIIRNGDLEIWVVDNTEPGSKPVKVEPASYEGVPVLKGTFEVKLNSRTRYPFVVEIFYNSKASRSYPDLIRAGVKVNKINSVPELKKSELWSMGTLTSKISFPALPPQMDAEAWDALKRNLQDGRIRDLWVEVIRTRVEPQVAHKLEEIQSKVHNDALAEAFKSVSEVVQEILTETPDLARLTFEQPEPPKKKREKGERGRTIPTSVRASVIDENNMAVPNVLVELYRDGALFTKQFTGLSGTVSFGRPGIGEYRFRVLLPQNSGFYSNLPLMHDFVLKRKLEGHRMVFQIVTGRKPPKQLKDTGFSLSMVTLDPSFFYTIDRMEYGSLGINVAGEHLSHAVDAGDDLRRDLLLAEFIAAGLTEFCFADHQLEMQHLIRTRLFSNLTARLISSKRRRR